MEIPDQSSEVAGVRLNINESMVRSGFQQLWGYICCHN